MKKLFALALAAMMTFSVVLSSCGNTSGTSDSSTGTGSSNAGEVSESKYDTLVIATQDFEGKFNPFYAESAYDQQITDQIFVSPQRLDKNNQMIDWAGSISYEEIEAEDGSTHILYTVKVNEGMTFSDGEPVTIDDLLYYYYVIADPSYTGPSSTWALTTAIVGLKEYYYDDPNYSTKVNEISQEVADKYSLDTISKEDYIAYLIDTNLEGWWDGDPAGLVSQDYTWSDYITDEGFGDQLAAIDATDPAAMLALLAEVEYTNYGDSYDPASYYSSKLSESYIAGNLEDGIDVETISGIVRVDDYTCTVEYYAIDIYGDRNINGALIPEHYYGEFEKGKAEEVVKANMDAPMGSGPYKFVSFDNNIVTCEANDGYFEGEPNIKTVKWQYVPDSDLFDALTSGEVDIANPNASPDSLEQYKDAGMEYSLIDNNGYGYLGINANNVEKNVRKGFMHLLAREASVNGYYGPELASVIERPMTTTLSEYPKDATEFYGYDPAKALECFQAAGYVQENGQLVKDGKKLTLSAYIGGSGEGDHPAYAMLVQAQTALAELGGELIIQDVQFATLQAAMNDGTADIFILAWGASNTCDKSTIYMTGGGQNRTNISNAELDQLLVEIPMTIDFDERCAKVARSLDIVMDEAVEMPIYQRKNMLAYNPEVVDISSLPEETTTYWTYESQLWKLKLN